MSLRADLEIVDWDAAVLGQNDQRSSGTEPLAAVRGEPPKAEYFCIYPTVNFACNFAH